MPGRYLHRTRTPSLNGSQPVKDTTIEKSAVTVVANNITVQGPPISKATNAGPGSPPQDEWHKDLIALRKTCHPLHILIIGKANAGKTTILRKMGDLLEEPVVCDQGGNPVGPWIIKPTDGRGTQNINHGLSFQSNPAFVFHDSPGFESGSTKELEEVQQFIATRKAATRLEDQLHAIWYCLPTDSSGPISNAEMSFFDQGTGKVPVIAIFTKYDGLILQEYNKLRYEQKHTRTEANNLAPKLAEELFIKSTHYLKRLECAKYPPAGYLRVQDLQKEGTSCVGLIQQTIKALKSKSLQELFVSVQFNNIGLSTKFAIKEFVVDALYHVVAGPVNPEAMYKLAREILCCYRHLFATFDYSVNDHDSHFHFADARVFLGILKTEFHFLMGQGAPALQILRLSSAILILAEDSFWFKEEGYAEEEAFELALERYRLSPRLKAVIKEVNAKFYEANIQDLARNRKEEIVYKLREIVKRYRASTSAGFC